MRLILISLLVISCGADSQVTQQEVSAVVEEREITKDCELIELLLEEGEYEASVEEIKECGLKDGTK